MIFRHVEIKVLVALEIRRKQLWFHFRDLILKLHSKIKT